MGHDAALSAIGESATPATSGLGTAYLVRHGESTANDRNVFTGAVAGPSGDERAPGFAPRRQRIAVGAKGPLGLRIAPCPSRATRHAGVHDVFLTSYGKLQARRAGAVRARLQAAPSTAAPFKRRLAACAEVHSG